MSRIDVAVSVAPDQSVALEALVGEVDAADIVEARALDGEAVVTAIVAVTMGSLGVLRAWLLSRSEERKNWHVQVDGMTFQGYTADEVSHVLSFIEQRLALNSADETADPD